MATPQSAEPQIFIVVSKSRLSDLLPRQSDLAENPRGDAWMALLFTRCLLLDAQVRDARRSVSQGS